MKNVFKIKGLDCANCAAQLANAIQKIEGVENISINFMMEKMILEYNEEYKQEIMKKIKKTITREEPDVTIVEILEGLLNNEKKSYYNTNCLDSIFDFYANPF